MQRRIKDQPATTDHSSPTRAHFEGEEMAHQRRIVAERPHHPVAETGATLDQQQQPGDRPRETNDFSVSGGVDGPDLPAEDRVHHSKGLVKRKRQPFARNRIQRTGSVSNQGQVASNDLSTPLLERPRTAVLEATGATRQSPSIFGNRASIRSKSAPTPSPSIATPTSRSPTGVT